MFLSDKTIKDYIEQGKIIILPEFDLKNIRPVGIRVHLGYDILKPKPGQVVGIDSKEEVGYETVKIDENGYILKPGEFILASTYERFQVPKNILCFIDGRSTVARLGMEVHCTSATVDGNFEEPRTVVLEIKNNGVFDLMLRPKNALAMVLFTELTTEIDQKVQTQYKGQIGAVPPNLKVQLE